MAEDRVVDWQVPTVETDPARRKGWYDELTTNGDNWVRSQRSVANVLKDVHLLMGYNQTNSMESNSLQIDVRTFVETISDLKMIALLGTKADQLKQSVQVYNGAFKYIFHDSQFVAKTRKALQYAMLGRGYLWQKYSRDKYGWGKGRIEFDALGPLEVLPEQLPADNDVQGSYAVTIIRAMPVAEAHARFPNFADQLVPISRYDLKSYGTLGMVRRFDFLDKFRFGQEQNADWENRYCEIRYHFIRDLRQNNTDREIDMESYAPWGYKVPGKGQLVVNTNPFNGLPESHTATADERRMYPQLRLAITSPSVNVPMRDSTGFDWHGEIPVVQYDVNDWAWSPLGHSLIHQVAGLEVASRALISKMQEVTEVNLDPPMGYDLHAGVSREQVNKLNLLKSSGYRVGTNGDPRKALQSMLPESISVREEHFKQYGLLDAERKNNLGLTDITALRDLKMNLSSDNVDKILENLGPIAKGIAGNMGIAHGKIANMLKYNIPQYIPVDSLIDMVGPEGVSIETFDNDPNCLVPSHLPGELPEAQSRYSKRQRAKWAVEKMGVVSTPTQLLNVTEMQERMTYMLFLQQGAKISTGTIMEKLGVDNYGGAKGDTEYEKWQNEQTDLMNFKIEEQVALAAAMRDAGLQPDGTQPPPGTPPPAAPPGGGPGQGKGGGRPHSMEAPPHEEMRGTTTGHPRTILSTSK